MCVPRHNSEGLRGKRRGQRGAKTWHNLQHKRSECRHKACLSSSSDKVVRLSEARYACETRLWELEQQFEVKAAKVREEYLAAVLEIHASEAKGNQRAHHS